MEIWQVHTKNVFMARFIHVGMRTYCLLRGIKQPDIVYNHALMYHNGYVYEADYPRVKKIPLEKWQKIKKNKRATIKKYNLQLTQNQEFKIYVFLELQIGKPYELINFFWHMIKIFTGKWYGRHDNKRLYCYELVIYAMNVIRMRDKIDCYLNPIEFNINLFKN